MNLPSLVLGAPRWWPIAAGAMALGVLLILWSYTRSRSKPSVRLACAILKLVAIGSLAFILLEPLFVGVRPRRGANAFAVLVDQSQSLGIKNENEDRSRGDWIQEQVREGAPWQARLGQDFNVRQYVFDTHLRGVDHFNDLGFDGTGSAIGGSLSALSKRFRGLPLAGVLLFTDGNRTDPADPDWSSLPPIYPIVPPAHGAIRDVSVRDVAITQTNFESAPVVLKAELTATGYTGQEIVAVVVDEAGKEVTREKQKVEADGKPLSFRFQFRPEKKGVSFFKVRGFPVSEESTEGTTSPGVTSTEQTLANNSRLVVVDQGAGPYRILYVGGRPNWEFKYLRRAMHDDEQVQLVGLLRIARRQPKFDFQAAGEKRTSPMFSGFDNADPDTVETADQAVLVRLGTIDEAELRDGFPKTEEDLYRYHAVVLDDIEAGFFTADQLALLRNFVSVRGGGLLMLGGTDAFSEGKYDRTPIGELLPVYLNGSLPPIADADAGDDSLRLTLTREGWLQPWVRIRKTEEEERRRLEGMPEFQTLSRVGAVKPGAVTLAEVTDQEGNNVPALVAQSFGKGHVAALLIGDLWKWGMHREHPEESDLERSWRQTARWLVSDVPSPVDMALRPKPDSSSPAIEIAVRIRDPEYRPLDNAKATVAVTLPGGDTIKLDTEPDSREAGLYRCAYVPNQPGAYRFLATATGADGAAVGTAEAGWAAQPAADEFARLEPDREFLSRLAEKTGGEVVDGSRLDSLVASLPSRGSPITEPWTTPLWHHPVYFLIALGCLVAEWGLRRLNGMA